MTMPPDCCRAEQPDDCAGIDGVHRLAFGQEDEARLVRKLRAAHGFDLTLSLVAVRDGELVGHILFSPIRIEGEGGDVPALALAPMAVLPAWQRRGVGSVLVHEGLAASRQAGHCIVVVVGHADYYPRFGFTPAGRRNLRLPFASPDAAFMALALMPGALKGLDGAIRYSPPFTDVI